jgi:polyisoprenoid-binding protein YceI
MKQKLALGVLLGLVAAPLYAAEYKIDPAHSFVAFRIQHLGMSWMYGQFNSVDGSFTWDAENPDSAKISVMVDPASVDTNHAERDKHLRSDDFLDVSEHGGASFESTKYTGSESEGVLEGNLTIRGVAKPIKIDVTRVGEGKDPWGGYRAGFHGTYMLTRADFGDDYDLGPTSQTMELMISIEGIRQ